MIDRLDIKIDESDQSLGQKIRLNLCVVNVVETHVIMTTQMRIQ